MSGREWLLETELLARSSTARVCAVPGERVKLQEFIERYGSLDDGAFKAGFGHPFLLQEGKLKVEGGNPAERQVFLLRPPAGSGKLVVGRSPSADVSIPDSQVSSKHAELTEQGGGWVITDSSSTNGTFVEGKKIPANVGQPLSDTLPVRFGPDAAFMFLSASSFLPIFRRIQEKLTAEEPLRAGVLDAETDHSGIPIRRIREAAQADARKKSGGDLFICCDGMDAVRLDPGRPVVIGRSPGHATMVLPHGEVSRAHVEIARQGLGATIRDLGSANGTFLCGVRLGASAVDLPLGKAVTIGPFTVTLQGPPSEAGLTVQVDAAQMRGASGDFEKTPLGDVLQEIEAEQKTGVLEVFSAAVIGRVSFRAGQPCNAKTDDGKGGEDAIRAMLAIKVGTFTLKSDASAVGPQRIERAFSDILLEDFLGS
jgi:pSer/pThr/pTyr-binding forkhead associated (FHA) protein